jgi:hypothetical protein
MSDEPEIVYIDPRVARTMPDQDPDDRMTAFIRLDIYEKDVRGASEREVERIIQLLAGPEGHLIGLSTWGRVWALVGEKDEVANWKLVQDAELGVKLDS